MLDIALMTAFVSYCMNQDGAMHHNSLWLTMCHRLNANIRKLVWRLLNVSDNALVRSALRSDLFAILHVLEGGVTFFSLFLVFLYFFVFYFSSSTCIVTVSWATSLLLN